VNYLDLLLLVGPETSVLVAGLLVLGVDLGWMRHRTIATRTRTAVTLSLLGLFASFVWSARMNLPAQGNLFDGMLVLDPLTRLGKQVVLVLSAFALLVSAYGQFTRHIGEYFLLLLLATVGMMFLIGSENILVIFIALELLSLSLYIMTAFNKQSIQSAEAALKYFLFGGMSAAFMLFGLSLIYGASGELNLSKIASNLKGVPLDPLVVIAMIMVVIGFGFKVAAVPFHLWAPDAYQGAPLPAAAFIASGSKVASFFILAKVLLVGFAGAEGSAVWQHFSKGSIQRREYRRRRCVVRSNQLRHCLCLVVGSARGALGKRFMEWNRRRHF
jgi:NADH-quinone oxidoreductase subunit N